MVDIIRQLEIDFPGHTFKQDRFDFYIDDIRVTAKYTSGESNLQELENSVDELDKDASAEEVLYYHVKKQIQLEINRRNSE
jgi:hypothetical protein